MRLLVKFNLILILVFALGIAAAGYFARDFLQEGAHDEVLQQARLMMGSASAMRTYTTKQVGPLLQEPSEADQYLFAADRACVFCDGSVQLSAHRICPIGRT